MKNDIIDFYYFSGTGNTLIAVNEMTQVFCEYGKKVNLHRIEISDSSSINSDHVIGIAFPVAVFSTYPFVWQFIKNLPSVNNNCEVFMLDTLAGFSGGIIGPIKKVLQNKGYNPIGAAEFIMPSNFSSIKSAEENQQTINKSLPKIKQYAYDLLLRKTKWCRIPILSDLMRIMSRTKYPWRMMSKWIVVDEIKCVKCGLCAKLCPVKAIEMQEFPVKNNNKCEVCMRCISFCPKTAYLFKGKQKRYRGVKADDLLMQYDIQDTK